MALLRVEEVKNGDTWTLIDYYSCDRCSYEIYEAFPHTAMGENTHYCLDCSFILGLVTDKHYLNLTGFGVINANASVRDGEIVIWTGKRAPWERTNQDIRNSKQYADWRTSVFKRDLYTCQHCKQVGGELNAHHIKPFAKYKELRFEITNGLTLCKPCHLEVHKKDKR